MYNASKLIKPEGDLMAHIVLHRSSYNDTADSVYCTQMGCCPGKGR